MRKRKIYTPEQKAQTSLTLLRGEKTQVEAARELGCHPNLVAEWQRKFLENAAAPFENEEARRAEATKVAELERMVGKLTVQIEFLKKVSGRMD